MQIPLLENLNLSASLATIWRDSFFRSAMTQENVAPDVEGSSSWSSGSSSSPASDSDELESGSNSGTSLNWRDCLASREPLFCSLCCTAATLLVAFASTFWICYELERPSHLCRWSQTKCKSSRGIFAEPHLQLMWALLEQPSQPSMSSQSLIGHWHLMISNTNSNLFRKHCFALSLSCFRLSSR